MPLPSTDVRPRHAASAGTEATLALLGELARATRFDLDAGSARRALEGGDPAEPLERVQRAASAAGVRVTPVRMAVADAVWRAADHLPIVGWSHSSGEWVAITRHGFFRARAWRSGEPEEGSKPIGRRALAELLGAPGIDVPVDLAIVQPERPAEPVAAPTDRAAHPHRSPFSRLVDLLRPEGPELWAIVVFSAITGVLYLALPLAVNAFISNLSFGARSGPVLQGLVALAVALFLCLSVGAALRGLQHVVAEVIQRRVFVRLGSDLAQRLPRVELESIDGIHAPELVNRFLDVVTVQKSGAMLLLTGINLVLGATIGLGVLAFYHPFLLALSIALAVAVAAIVFLVGRRAVDTAVAESRRKYEVVDWLEELARHPRVFKGSGGAELAANRADEHLRAYLDARKGHFRILIRQVAGLLALEVVAGTVLLAVGGWLVLNQQLTLGQLVASEIILSTIVASISKLGKQFEAWYDAVAAMDKLGHLLDLRTERTGGEAAPCPAAGARIEVRGIAYARLGRRPAFEGVSFTVEPGERVALLGSRGTGTSSVPELVLGMRRPLAGEILVDGLDVRSWDLDRLRDQACILRSTDLIAGTIADNVRLGRPDIPQAEVQAAVTAAGLGEAMRLFPDGLQTPLVTGGLPLTGRQRARLLAARALATRPRLLLVDELLDGHEGTLDALAKALLDAPLPWTVVIVTRDRRVAARCGRTIELGQEEARHG